MQRFAGICEALLLFSFVSLYYPASQVVPFLESLTPNFADTQIIIVQNRQYIFNSLSNLKLTLVERHDHWIAHHTDDNPSTTYTICST